MTLLRALRAQCHKRSRLSPAGASRLAGWKTLSAARRKVVELAYFGGLSYVQIGRAFGVPSAA